MENKNGLPKAMAFYHSEGFVPAWKQASRFIGKDGRMATMPDIITARLGTKPGDDPWETYYTTLTAEYYGISKSGKLILIVAHGIGPMSTLEGIQKAYSWEYKDKNRDHRGGRIAQQEFLDLEAGKFGEVSIIDYESYCRRYEYPFIQTLRASEAITDPVLKARFGPQTEQYVLAHASYAREWHREQAEINPNRQSQHLRDGAEKSDPYIIQLHDAANCSYLGSNCRLPEKGFAIAHLISTGRLVHLCHEGNESLTLDVSCHEWWNGVRLLGIQAGGNTKTGIHSGPDAYNLLRKHWRKLLRPVSAPDVAPIGFRALVQIDKQWFTQYPKQGESMNTWEPEHVVTSMEKVGEPILFRTTVGGYHGFFKFGVNEVEAIAPPNANAYYFVSEPQNEWHGGNPTHQTAMVQFYRIAADTSKKLLREQELRNDYDTLMSLLS